MSESIMPRFLLPFFLRMIPCCAANGFASAIGFKGLTDRGVDYE